MGGIDQEQLTTEEKEEQIIKTLKANNPRAPHNICSFSFKDRTWKVDDQVDHLVFHVNIDGNILLKDSDDFRDQDDYWENKKRMNQILLENMNKAIKEEFSDDPRKLQFFKYSPSIFNLPLFELNYLNICIFSFCRW